MTIKVEATLNLNKTFDYPVIMHDPEERLVLFMTEPSVGFVLKPGSTRYVAGYFGRNWFMSRLRPFDGRVTLENA